MTPHSLSSSLPSVSTAQRGAWFLSLLVILAFILAACGGGSSPTSTTQKSSVLTIPWNGPFVQTFNPFTAVANGMPGARGMIYETLIFMNFLQSGAVTPWLATSYQFSSDANTLTFHLRPNVQWSDGKPFSSTDVIFTLNLLKQYPALDTNGLWNYLKSVSAPDASTVVVTLKQPYSPILYYLGDQTWIVPQHIWSNIADPTKYADTNPIGTGPFMFQSFSTQLIALSKNPRYWQPGKPQVTGLHYIVTQSNNSEELLLDQGQVDWDGQFLPNVQKSFVSRDPAHYHYWFPPTTTTMLYLNLAKSPFNLLPVRQAISYAINRQQLDTAGESGYQPPANPTALVLPAQQKYLSSDYTNASFRVDTGKANQLLQSAGFTKGSNGIYVDKSGKPLSFTMNAVTGWTDWVTDLQIISANLKAIGINASVNAISFNSYYVAMQTGNFDAAISWTTSGPT
ncbi:MAG TPA: ABC transporter substrate-binding protein, partial [Ktedonobacteraceae bacterium]|nr:ABC transporter substrate-binding protein [Ktedonobacteraceae bacterium]